MRISFSKDIRSACETAIKLAEESRGYIEDDPEIHPLVGAAILDANGIELSTGARRKDGRSHAEIYAIEHLEDSNENSAPHTFVTTLEPCSYRANHESEICCVKRVIRLGVRQTIIGTLDPAMGVRGRGVHILQGRQVYVTMFPKDLQSQVINQNEKYLSLHWDLYARGKRVSHKKGIVKDDQEFDLKFASKRLRGYLTGRQFARRIEPVYRFFVDTDLGSSADAFAEYFSIVVTSDSSALAQEMETPRGPEKSLFESIADYLAIPPGESEEQKSYWRAAVYQFIGKWWFKRRRHGFLRKLWRRFGER